MSGPEIDPWVDQLASLELGLRPLNLADPENVETIILRRLCNKFSLKTIHIEPYIQLVSHQFAIDYAYGRSVRSCFRIAEETYLSVIPADVRQKLLHSPTGRGHDPFSLRRGEHGTGKKNLP